MAYGKGGADKQCTHPPSLMDSCHNDDSVLQARFMLGFVNKCCKFGMFQIKYQACPDIQGSESKGEDDCAD